MTITIRILFGKRIQFHQIYFRFEYIDCTFNNSNCRKLTNYSELNKLKESYESLVESISKELEFYKVKHIAPKELRCIDSFVLNVVMNTKHLFQTEHSVLKSEINALTSQNNAARLNEFSDDLTNYKKLSEAAVGNLKSQIEKLKQVSTLKSFGFFEPNHTFVCHLSNHPLHMLTARFLQTYNFHIL